MNCTRCGAELDEFGPHLCDDQDISRPPRRAPKPIFGGMSAMVERRLGPRSDAERALCVMSPAELRAIAALAQPPRDPESEMEIPIRPIYRTTLRALERRQIIDSHGNLSPWGREIARALESRGKGAATLAKGAGKEVAGG
jgi:hypothetical protein